MIDGVTGSTMMISNLKSGLFTCNLWANGLRKKKPNMEKYLAAYTCLWEESCGFKHPNLAMHNIWIHKLL